MEWRYWKANKCSKNPGRAKKVSRSDIQSSVYTGDFLMLVADRHNPKTPDRFYLKFKYKHKNKRLIQGRKYVPTIRSKRNMFYKDTY